MNYSVKIGKKSVALPKFTIKIEKACSEVIDTAKKYEADDIDVEQLLQKEISFLKSIIDSDVVDAEFGTDIDEIDIHDVDNLCMDIILEYQRPAREKQQKELEERYAPVKKVLSDKSVSDALKVAASNKNV